jgi:glutathione S-transferase
VIKLHRCSGTFVKGPHPCWQVQKALDERGVPYEIVKHPAFPRGRRKDLIAKTGQDRLPAVELDDGSIIRMESKDLAAAIRNGSLFPASPGAGP